MKSSGKTSFRPYFPILFVMLIWGSMGIPSTYAVEEYSPLCVLCFRSGIAAAVLYPIIRQRNRSIAPAPGERKLLILLAVVGVVLCNYLYFYAVRNTKLTNVAILYALGPIITTILAAIFLKEKIHQTRFLGIVIAFFGVIALVTGGDLGLIFEIHFCNGDIAELMSSVCLAVYTILSKKITKTPPDCTVFWLMMISFLVTLPILIFTEGKGFVFADMRATASVLYLGVFCSAVGYLLQQQSIQQIGASASAAFLNGISPITILTAALILREIISPMQFFCMIAVFLGLFLNASNRTFWKCR